MENGIVIPPGYSPPFAVVTENDHTAWIVIATSLGLACALLFGGIRILLRSTICPGVGLDDCIIGAATVSITISLEPSTALSSSLTHFTLLTMISDLGPNNNSVLRHSGSLPQWTGEDDRSCSSSYYRQSPAGKCIQVSFGHQNHHLILHQQLYYSGMLLFIIALGLSKLSIIAFLLRLTTIKVHRITYYTLAALVIAWTIGSFFAIVLQCNLSRPWAVVGESCSGTLLRWQAICALDIVTEVAIVAGSMFLVWFLQTPLTTKVMVVSTFACRLLQVLARNMQSYC